MTVIKIILQKQMDLLLILAPIHLESILLINGFQVVQELILFLLVMMESNGFHKEILFFQFNVMMFFGMDFYGLLLAAEQIVLPIVMTDFHGLVLEPVFLPMLIEFPGMEKSLLSLEMDLTV